MDPDQLNIMNSNYIILRELFSRLVISLQMGSSLSMEIIALWLWIQANGLADFLLNIDSFDDYHVLMLASYAKYFIEVLHMELTDANGRSVPRSEFQKAAIEGIFFYLNKVCYKVFNDLDRSQTREVFHEMNQAYVEPQPLLYRSSMSVSHLSVPKYLLNKIRSIYTNNKKHQGEGTSISRNALQVQIGCRIVLQDIHEGINGYHQSAPHLTTHLTTLLGNLSIRERHKDAVIMQQLSDVPHDERTLFVTFSNGYPLTKDELHEFFMRNYGDIEEITIEEQVEARPPLYAQVTFFSQLTLFRVLDGKKRVKFMTRGKHLWACQFVPKKKKLKVEEL